MPYKSKAQQGKFHAMLDKGQIAKSTVNEFDQASKGLNLPPKSNSFQKAKTAAAKAKAND